MGIILYRKITGKSKTYPTSETTGSILRLVYPWCKLWSPWMAIACSFSTRLRTDSVFWYDQARMWKYGDTVNGIYHTQEWLGLLGEIDGYINQCIYNGIESYYRLIDIYGWFPKMGGTPKSSILMGFSISKPSIFGGTSIYGHHHYEMVVLADWVFHLPVVVTRKFVCFVPRESPTQDLHDLLAKIPSGCLTLLWNKRRCTFDA